MRLLARATLGLLAACAGEAPNATSPPPEALTWEAERGPVRMELALVPPRPQLSDEPTLTLTITAAEGVEVDLPPFGESLGSFVIRDYRAPLPEVGEGITRYRQIYRLEPLAVGEQTILPIPVTFHDRRPGQEPRTLQVVTDPQTVEVVSLLDGEVPSLSLLRPAAPARELPAPPLSPWWWAVPVGLVGLLVAFLLWLRRHRLRAPRERVLSPQEQAHRELQALLQDDPLGRGEVKAYYVELTAVVRRFIERSTGVRAPEQTTTEFLRAIQGQGVYSGDHRQRLVAFLESADLVKFAAFQPDPGQIEASLERAREFVGVPGPPRPAWEAAA